MAKRTNKTGNEACNDGNNKKARKDERPPIPVTILSGFLGSGKTTLLQHILTSKEHKLKIAVIVNDMSELNIDGQTISRTQKEVVTLENGCICCTLRGDLIREINHIRETEQFDYVLIESTGIAEPQQVAESFCVDPETQALAGDDAKMLWNSARLDTCVTVVDAVNFPNYLSSLKRFQEIFQDGLDDAEEQEGEKSVSELMVEQVEFANVILLNKVDLVSDKKLEIAKTLIHALNPKALVVTGSYGKVDLNTMLNTSLFNMKDASESPGWLLSLQDGVDASHGEADEYGISSFVYRSRKPFHPQRLHTFLAQFFCFAEDWNTSQTAVKIAASTKSTNELVLEKKYGSILRSKGTCWIAGRDDHEIGWAQAGRIIQLSPTAEWYCKTDPNEWDDVETDDDRARIEALFEGTDDRGSSFKHTHGDRRQEVVFIGTSLQRGAIEEGLNTCLLSEVEMEHHSTGAPIGAYPDPLHPILVPCDGARSVFVISRPGQNHHIRIFPGFSLTIHTLALNVTAVDDNDIQAVKVWLDKSDGVQMGVLLATLRPIHYEQHAVSLSMLPCDEEGGEEVTNRRIRVEVILKKGAKKFSSTEMMNLCEVHMMAKSEPVPYSPADDDDEDDEDMDDCLTGHCEAGAASA